MKSKKIVIRVDVPETLDELLEWGESSIPNESEKLGFQLAIYKIKKLGLCPPEMPTWLAEAGQQKR